jgi:hypothetical protein
MRTLNLLNRDVAGAAWPDGFAAAGGLLATDVLAGAMPGFTPGFMAGVATDLAVGAATGLASAFTGRFGDTASESVTADGRAAVRGGRLAVGLKAGSVAAAATFSAVVFSDAANATVSSHVGGRVTTGAADGCPGVGGLIDGAAFARVEICCAEAGGTDV